MASPEIDEAAAVEYAEDLQRWMHGYWGAKANLARAALAWKARAENLAASPSAQQEIEHLAGQLETLLAENRALVARAEAAEAERDFLRRGLCAAEIERDSLRRQLVQSVKAR